jgi:hypothetical protein
MSDGYVVAEFRGGGEVVVEGGANLITLLPTQ